MFRLLINEQHYRILVVYDIAFTWLRSLSLAAWRKASVWCFTNIHPAFLHFPLLGYFFVASSLAALYLLSIA